MSTPIELTLLLPDDEDGVIPLAASIAQTAAILLASGKATTPSMSPVKSQDSYPEAAAIDSALVLYQLATGRLLAALQKSRPLGE